LADLRGAHSRIKSKEDSSNSRQKSNSRSRTPKAKENSKNIKDESRSNKLLPKISNMNKNIVNKIKTNLELQTKSPKNGVNQNNSFVLSNKKKITTSPFTQKRDIKHLIMNTSSNNPVNTSINQALSTLVKENSKKYDPKNSFEEIRKGIKKYSLKEIQHKRIGSIGINSKNKKK
jgi:hypothetical protein